MLAKVTDRIGRIGIFEIEIETEYNPISTGWDWNWLLPELHMFGVVAHEGWVGLPHPPFVMTTTKP